MRTRQAQQLQADVYARLDEVTTSAGGFSSGVKPAPADCLEWINQAWAKVYRKLIQAGYTWNQRESIFSTVSGQDMYGFLTARSSNGGAVVANATAPWTAGVSSVAFPGAGAGVTNGTWPITFTGGSPVPGAVAPVATATVVGGSIVSTTVTSQGSGYATLPSPSISAGGGGIALVPVMSSDYWKTGGVDVQLSGTQWFPAHRFQFEQRNDYQLSDWSWPRRILYDAWGGTSDASGSDGTMLKFLPSPPGGYQVRHWWYPAPQRLVAPTDVFDGVAGAELVCVLAACADAALQTEQWELADRFEAKAAAELQDVMSSLRDRNVGEAPMARVVRGRPTRWGDRTAWWRG